MLKRSTPVLALVAAVALAACATTAPSETAAPSGAAASSEQPEPPVTLPFQAEPIVRAALESFLAWRDGILDGSIEPDSDWTRQVCQTLDIAAAAETSFAREIIERAARDQFMRLAFINIRNDGLPAAVTPKLTPAQVQTLSFLVTEETMIVDKENTAWLKAEVAARGGWPKISEVGELASQMAWLLVQHADHDPEFQKDMLALMEPLVAEEEISARNYAYLEDRVARAEGRPQRFGTQGQCMPEGGWAPRELADPENVDALRAEMGLEPLDDYIAVFVEQRLCPPRRE